ncbi:MAG: histidine kinase [Bacteroidia bacterium]|nr:histidine kinase [Bacteroidia bacterium]
MLFRLKYYYILFFITVLGSITLNAQELEKLKQELNSVNDQQRSALYLRIAVLHIEKYGNPDSVLKYSQKAEKSFEHVSNTYQRYKAQLYSAIGYQQKNKFDTALTILKKIVDSSIKNDSLKADACYYSGITCYRAGDKKSALDHFLKAMSLYKEQSNVDGLALTYCKLADVLVTDLQNEEALTYKNKAVALLPSLNRPYTKIFVNNLLSRLYMDLRNVSQAYIDSSIFYAKQSYAFMKEYGYYLRAYQVLNIISDNYFIIEDYETGIEYCKESLKFRKYLYPGEIISCYIKFSDYYNLKKEPLKALVYLDSMKMNLTYINVQYYWLNYYQRYYEYNKNAGNTKEALYGIERYNALKDSVYNVDKSKEINELVQKYDKAENEKKIMELNAEREIASVNTKFLIAGVIASLFAIIIIIFFYRQSLVKNKLKTIETEQRLNRARMDPHFFFNALSSLQGLVNDDKRKKEASDYISNFSKIMRQSLESTYLETVSIEDEIDFLKNYLELQKLRTGNKFNYSFNYDKDLEINELLIPSMMLQPFIENSIEHGFVDIDKDGSITINFSVKENNLLIKIIDNGVGLKQANKSKDHTSRAIQIIKDRLYLLNQKHKTNATFAIVENLTGGTKVEIILPVIN